MDKMKITVLADGTIKTETDAISPANHQSAEDFLTGVQYLAGGEQTRTVKSGDGAHQHHHHHDHVHQH